MCRFNLFSLSQFIALIVALQMISPIRAGVIAGFVPAAQSSHDRYDIYSSGFAGAPVRNTNPSFIGSGLDLTGIGFMANNGLQGVTMISRQHFLMTAHFPPSTTQVNFVTAANQLRSYTIASTMPLLTGMFNGMAVNGVSDVLIGRLTAPIPAGDGIGFLPLAFDPSLDLINGPIPAQNIYNTLPLLTHGFNGGYPAPNGFTSPHIGTNVADRGPNLTVEAGVSSITFGYDYNSGLNGEFHSISGDSGSPSTTLFGGSLALVGLHYDLLGDNSSIDLLLPYYIPQMNAFMQPDNMQVTTVTVPEPSTLILLSLTAGYGYWRRRRGNPR